MKRTRLNLLMWSSSRISARKDRAGAAWSPLGETVRGQGGSMGRVRGDVRGRNFTRVCFNTWSGEPVYQLLDSSRGPPSGRGRKSTTTGAVTMAMLTQNEKAFLDVFLHEATTHPFFNGPATKALHAIGVDYRDISYLAWAYDQEVPRTGFGWRHAAEVAPSLPWSTRAVALGRNEEVQRIWELKREPVHSANAS